MSLMFVICGIQLQAKAKSRKEKLGGFISNMSKSIDSSFNNFKDPDEYFDLQRSFIVHYIAWYAHDRTHLPRPCCTSLLTSLDLLRSSLL